MSDENKDLSEYLARIRKTIADSEALVSQAELRIAETDRLLEQQGLSREQVMAMQFSSTQIEAVNEELKRRGIDPLERWSGVAQERIRPDIPSLDQTPLSPMSSEDSAELENRQRKFGLMMKPFQI